MFSPPAGGKKTVIRNNMKRIAKKILVLLLTAVLIIPQAACSANGGGQKEGTSGSGQAAAADDEKEIRGPVTGQDFHFDTVCQITIYSMDHMTQAAADDALEQAFALCGTYEDMLSKTLEGTDIYRINHAGGGPVECDPETVEIIRMGLQYAELSDGKFDITIGKAVDLWDFHADAVPAVPDPALLSEAVSHVDYKTVSIEGSQVTLTDPEAEIDLGGIAKGYVADRVCEKLEECGVTGAIVSLGGNVDCLGSKPDGKKEKDFVVGIEAPYSDKSEVVGSTPASDRTVVTSGVYERFFTYEGREYHHILDPETGYPADSDVLGVSIAAARGKSADCDALATICLILGAEKGMELVESMDGFEALFITRENKILTTEGFDFTKR